MEDREFTIETPVGSISSDSGNHVIDIISVVGVILMLYVCKKLIGKYLYCHIKIISSKEILEK